MKTLTSLIGAGLISSIGIGQAALVAHYTFDEGSGTTAADSAGGDQNASTNQGTIGWTAAGKIGGALDLGGSASMQAADAIGVSATAFTISTWVNMDDTPGYDGIFETRAENWGVNVEGGSAANLHVDYRYDNVPGGGSTGYDSANGSITVGTWHHIAMTWRNDGTGEMYLDGALVTSATGAPTSYTASSQMWNIGDDPCCGGREINAQLDDFAVWDEALTAGDITKIFNGGNSGLNAPEALAVPEPSSVLLTGLAALGLLRRRR